MDEHVIEEEEEGDRISLKHALLKDLSNQSNITFIHDKTAQPHGNSFQEFLRQIGRGRFHKYSPKFN